MDKDVPEGSTWTRMYQRGSTRTRMYQRRSTAHTHGITRLMIINRG